MKLQPILLLLATAVLASAEPYSISWSTIDGGGGTSTGGVYSVSGTIGQPDAGQMSGGDFSLSGGFWSVLAAVQNPGAPLLTIVNTGTNAVKVLWPNLSTGWRLQQCTDLNAGNWSASTLTLSVEGTNRCAIISPPAGNLFFRLQQ